MSAEEDDNDNIQEESHVLTQGEGSESNSICMICMEEWTIGSEHRVCCLKCGHLFGRSCIERWIKEKGSNAKCPTCNKPSKKQDLRDLWCKSIKASDTTEICQLRKQLEDERKLRKTDSAVIFHQNLKLELLHGELDKLKKNIIERDQKIFRLESLLDRLNKLRAQRSTVDSENDLVELERVNIEYADNVINVDEVEPRELKGMFHFAERVESSSTGGCKSFALCPISSIILVAQPTPHGNTNVFGGYGLRKYSTLDTNVREFIPLHSKVITSVQLKPIGDLILTSGQDKKVRLTSITNNACIHTYNCQYEPTCVAWSSHRDQQFYVGSSNCYVTLYDIRNTSDCIYQTSGRVAKTRLLSLASITGQDTPDGILINDSKGSQFLEISPSSDYQMQTIDRSVEHLTSYQLPFDGLMGTVDFYKKESLALITTRRTPLNPNCAHNLVKVRKTFDESGATKIECERVKSFFGGRSADLLGQSRIVQHPTAPNGVLVGACDDAARGIKLWDATDNTEYQTIKTDAFVRDLLMYNPENTNQYYLYTLSEKGLSIYRWDYA